MKTKHEIAQEQSALVVKSNFILREIRYDLTAQEQKILIYLISKVSAEDKDFKHVDLSIVDYCQLTNHEYGSKTYKDIKKSIKTLRDKSWWVEDENGETLFSWIDSATIKVENGKKLKGTIDIVLSESLRPYLLNLKENFTKYELFHILLLRSKHSIRLYELFKSYLWLGEWKVSVDTFKELLNLSGSYSEYKALNRSVIVPALKEINTYTDLIVEYEPIRDGRFIKQIHFKIKEKKGSQLVFETFLKQQERLG